MISVPFSTPDTNSGLSECKGHLVLDEDLITIHAEVAFIGLFKQNEATVRFEITDLDHVRHKRTVIGDRLTLRTQPPSLAMEVPGAAQGELVLKVKKKHRRDVDALLDRLELWIVK